VRREVIEPYDHRDLNRDTAAFVKAVATTENLAREICRRLKRGWRETFPGDWPRLEKIRIAETPRNIFEMRADEIE
jgi:6-pyruvoyl-tetrahydropterin synthase